MLINYQSQQVDSSGKGKLDYGEFVAISLHLQRMANDEHLKRAFSYFDKDGNGYIDPQELQEALVEDGAADSADVANDILQEVDTDKVRREYPPTFSTSFPSGSPSHELCFLPFGTYRMDGSATKSLLRWWKLEPIGEKLPDTTQEEGSTVSASDLWRMGQLTWAVSEVRLFLGLFHAMDYFSLCSFWVYHMNLVFPPFFLMLIM